MSKFIAKIYVFFKKYINFADIKKNIYEKDGFTIQYSQFV